MLAKPPLWEKPFGFAKYNPVEPLGLSDAVFDAGYITNWLIRDVPPWLNLNEHAKAVNVILFFYIFFSLRKSFSTSDCVKENKNTKATPLFKDGLQKVLFVSTFSFFICRHSSDFCVEDSRSGSSDQFIVG